MPLLTEDQIILLKHRGHIENCDQDHPPAVKLHLPWTGCVWLLSEIDPEDPDIAFGLCDLGLGFPELGNVSLSELQSITFMEDIGVEQDPQFTGDFPMSVYAAAARANQAITTDPIALKQAQANLQRRAKPKHPRLS